MRSVRSLTLPALATALMVVMSQLSVPLGATSITLQTFAVALSGYLLGAKDGLLSIVAYLLLGVCGLPVFSCFSGGLGVLLGPTGGFLLAFPVMAFLCGLGRNRRTCALAAGFAGLLVVYIMGTLQMSLITGMTLGKACLTGVVPFVLKDVASVWAAFGVSRTIHRRIRR